MVPKDGRGNRPGGGGLGSGNRFDRPACRGRSRACRARPRSCRRGGGARAGWYNQVVRDTMGAGHTSGAQGETLMGSDTSNDDMRMGGSANSVRTGIKAKLGSTSTEDAMDR